MKYIYIIIALIFSFSVQCQNIYIPNAFTPDKIGPSINNKFTIICDSVAKYNIIIYNKWGEKLFKSDNIQNSWDGYYQSYLCPPTIYFYQIYIIKINKPIRTYSGVVYLLYDKFKWYE